MTKDEVDLILENCEFQFAKTMARHPHSYTLLHKHWNYEKDLWFSMVEFIWNNSVKEHWKYGHYYNYYYANGYKYWSMDKTILTTDLINRAKV
jgi:hypothetical protein